MVVAAATGHRPKALGSSYTPERLFVLAVDCLMFLGPDRVVTGMALGWDTAVAKASYVLGIPFTAAIPFVGQDERWSPADRAMYEELLGYAAQTEIISPFRLNVAYERRDRWMVDEGDIVVALFSGDYDTGTGKTVRYAERSELPILNYWASWQRYITTLGSSSGTPWPGARSRRWESRRS